MSPSVLDDLAARAAAAAGRPGQLDESSLAAFALIDPAGAASWLLAKSASESAELPRGRLLRFLASLAESIGRSPDAVPTREILDLLRRFGHLLAPEAAADLASVARVSVVDADLDAALRAALERAPANAGLLRPAAELAAAAGDQPRAHDLLTRLARADTRLATTQYVYSARSKLLGSDNPRVKIALLSSFTVDSLVPYLDVECRSLRLEPEVYLAPFNTWEREMLGEGSALQRFEPQIAFLAVSADDLLPGLAAGTDADLAAAGAAAVDRVLIAATRFTSWTSAVLVVHGLHSAFRDPLGPAAGRTSPGRSEILSELNARLADGLRALPRAYLLDLPDVIARRRQGKHDNPKMRHLASMRLNEHVLSDLAAAYAGYIAPLMGRTRKCVVLDLDNTLWGGIVGEDGPNGIRLGNTSPGSEYREFQQYLLSLTKRGILLAVNSKNNEADALEVIRSHDAMILREASFSAMRINWETKPNNMVSLAQELSIGLDSFVFVDDNDKERELMRQTLPQVLTPDMPKDPALYRETLEALAELQVLTVTEEDRTRTRQYVERRQREQLRVTAQTPEGYLASLEIVADIGTVSDRTLARVHQLFLRTNQFNLTGRRYELGALSARAGGDGWRIYTTHVSDRFGDHGLVATAVVHVTPETWTIDNLVMSCRVIGYGVEDALLARLATDARESNASALSGEFIPSPKNAPARDFYARNAFERDGAAGAERWRKDLSIEVASPAWISVRSTNGA
jgi:FkbH-like protein